MKVRVVTAYVPLKVKHLTEAQYNQLGCELTNAVVQVAPMRIYDGTLEDLWLYQRGNYPLMPANPVPLDRYTGPAMNVASNIIQHNRTTWAMRAFEESPDTDVIVWLDFGILKQGEWRSNKITGEHVKNFLRKVESTPEPMDFIPFPGISQPEEVLPVGNNWRFCGSTHIWPTKFLPDIDKAYKNELIKWMDRNQTTPLDLPIWALVEQNSGLPFRWYQAEYDASQLDNYPWG